MKTSKKRLTGGFCKINGSGQLSLLREKHIGPRLLRKEVRRIDKHDTGCCSSVKHRELRLAKGFGEKTE